MSSPPPAPTSSWRAVLLRELPLLVGLMLGLGFLFHPGWVRFGYPHGADWDTYLGSAAHLWIDPREFRYNEWRQPLYPWLVGLFGGASYVLAGQVMALAGTACTVVGAGLLARALATPWAAGLAALATATLPMVVDGSWWVNPYPVMGGLAALGLAAAAWCCRWPGRPTALLAGLLGGLCLAMDPRGLAVAAAVPLLVVLGPGGLRRRGLLLGIAVLGLGGGWGLDLGLRHRHGLELRPLASQIGAQHQENRGPDVPFDEAMAAEARACAQTANQDLGPRSLLGDCARQRRSLNQRAMRQAGHLPPAVASLLLLALCWLPAGWGRRSSAAGVLVFGPPAASLLLGMSWVPYVDRYLLPIAAVIGCLGPVVAVRLGGVAARRWPQRRWLALVGPGLALGWVALIHPVLHPIDLVQPTEHIARRKGEMPASVDPRRVLADWARVTVGPDDLLLDCAELRLQMLLLPSTLPVWDAPPHDSRCHQRMERPPEVAGQVWLVSLHQRGRKPDPRLVGPEWIAAHGWEELPLDLDLEEGTHAAQRASWLRRWRWAR